MDAQARIARTEGEGLITPAQARALRDGLEAPRVAPEPPRRSPARAATLIAVGIVVACVIALVVVGDDVAEVQADQFSPLHLLWPDRSTPWPRRAFSPPREAGRFAA